MASIIIAGATGAIGRELVAFAVASDRISRVVALSRRAVAPAQFAASFPGIDEAKASAKLTVQSVDWEALSGPAPLAATPEELLANAGEGVRQAFSGHTIAAMCMGTTRKDAGSAKAFERCDLEYVVTFCKLVKALNVPGTLRQFSQISSSGADASSWFLYMATKGKADEAAVGVGFPRVSIFRPGLLARKEKTRTVEKLAKMCFVPAMPVERVASALLEDALDPGRVGEVKAPVQQDASMPNVFFIANAGINSLHAVPNRVPKM